MSDGAPLGPGGEFDLIRALLARWGERARGVGDDAAVLDVPPGERLVVSADSSVEHVHFRREWLEPREIGWRAAASALSDLAAMGAAPLGLLASLSIPERWLADVPALAEGVGDAAAAAGAPIVGGDITRSSELVLAITVLGHAASPLSRGGARDGDALWVTGTFGGPLAALRALERGERPDDAARDRFAHPVPRLREGRWLAQRGARAALDVSDGLLGDAGHLAAASGARVVLELDALPTVPGVSPADAARSGEEYELLVAAPHELDARAFEREFRLPLTRVGRVERGPAEVRATLRGARVAPVGGFSHFS
ncbi:MAG TPA: thiamine-phosphate kinase [Gemmatimonadaceae bacterium]